MAQSIQEWAIDFNWTRIQLTTASFSIEIPGDLGTDRFFDNSRRATVPRPDPGRHLAETGLVDSWPTNRPREVWRQFNASILHDGVLYGFDSAGFKAMDVMSGGELADYSQINHFTLTQKPRGIPSRPQAGDRWLGRRCRLRYLRPMLGVARMMSILVFHTPRASARES